MHETNESPGGLGQGSREVRDTPDVSSEAAISHFLSPEDREFLIGQAVDPDFALNQLGVCSVHTVGDLEDDWKQGIGRYIPENRGILFPWVSVDGQRTAAQLRPDENRRPLDSTTGEPMKYIFQKGRPPVLWAARVVENPAGIILTEGSKQTIVAAQHAPADWSVFGLAGCWGWSDDGVPISDLEVVHDLPVKIILDADMGSNLNVWNAGDRLRDALKAEGASLIEWVKLPAGRKAALDDVLAARTSYDKRTEYLGRLLAEATERMPAKPRAKKKAAGGAPKPPNGLEPLNVTNVADSSDWLRQKLGTGNLAAYFLRDGEIVHLPAEGEEGYVKLSDKENEQGQRDSDGPAQVRTAGHRQVAARVGFSYWCFTEDGDGGQNHAMFPPAAAESVAAVPDLLNGVRKLRGVTHTPLVRRDGSILDTPGFDTSTGLYFLPLDGLEVPPVPDEPSADQLAAAVRMLYEVVPDQGGFPFRSDDHRANFLGLMLTPLMRELCPPPYKLGVFDAPQSRTGKTLLSKVLRTLHGGVFRSSVPADEAEWSKTLSTILNVTSAPIITFDNVRGELTSGTFDGLLTEDTFNARQLGVTDKMIMRRNDRVWTITSNNAKLGGDLAKRALWVSINANRTDPEARSGFRHPDLIDWITCNRGELLGALLTLVRAWVVAGRPAPSLPGTDIWRHWTSTVRAVLEHAGVPGVFDRPESKRQEVSDEDQDWTLFMRAVSRVFGDQPWTTRQLLDAVDKTELLEKDGQPTIHPDELPGKLAEKYAMGMDVAKSLGRFLSYKTEAWVGGFMVREAGTIGRNASKLYRVEIETNGSESDKPNPAGGPQTPDAAGFAVFAGFDSNHPDEDPTVSSVSNPSQHTSGVGVEVQTVAGEPRKHCKPRTGDDEGSLEDRERADQAAYKAEHPEPVLMNFPCPSCEADPADPCSPDPEGCDERYGLLIEARQLWDFDAVNHSMNLGYERQQDPAHLAGYRCTTDNHIKFMQEHGVRR
jgi:hypothetical protein